MTELGYQRIGFVSLSDIRESAQNWFLGGYCLGRFAVPAGRRVPELFLPLTDRNNPAPLAAWIRRHKPDAILTELAELPQMLRQIGVKVPGDIGLATLNTIDSNIEAGIYQNPERIGKAAAEVLIALVNRNERGGSPDYRTTTVMGRWQDGPTLPPRAAVS